MTNLNQQPNTVIEGLKDNGESVFRLPLKNTFDKNKTYRFIYEIQNIEGETLYPKRVDLTFSGLEIMKSLVKLYSFFTSSYNGKKEDEFLGFRHFVKQHMTVYTYLKIKGDTPSVRRELKTVFGMTSKDVKYLLKNKDLLMDCVKSYLYTKIDERNTVLCKDVECMSDEDIQNELNGFDWSKETTLHKLYDSEEDYIDSMKNGYITSETFDTDFSNIKTLH